MLVVLNFGVLLLVCVMSFDLMIGNPYVGEYFYIMIYMEREAPIYWTGHVDINCFIGITQMLAIAVDFHRLAQASKRQKAHFLLLIILLHPA